MKLELILAVPRTRLVYCIPIGWLVVGLFTLEVSAGSPPSMQPSTHHGDLLERLLRIDASFHDPGVQALARSIADELLREVLSCRESAATEQQSIECVFARALDEPAIAPVANPTPAESTVTSALAERRGSCAALVGLVLALTEKQRLFNAVILRDHVLLACRDARDEFFETLEEGRRLGKSDLSRYGLAPDEDPVVVGPDEYVAYYIDNLAARLEQEGGAAERVESMFNEALEIAPKASRIRYNYGTFLLQQKRFTEAEEMLSRAISAGWKDADAFVNRGAARWRLGQLRAARRDFEKALKLDPTNRQAKVNLQQLPR